MRDPARLEVWNEALGLARLVYRSTAKYPSDERFGLTSQSRRASVSIAANIAEGYGRASQREFARFLRIAAGSVAELKTLLVLAADLGVGDPADHREIDQRLARVSKMITAFSRAIEHRLDE